MSICLMFVAVTLGFGMIIAWLPLTFIALWFIYRIVRGWLALQRRQPMYA